MYNDLLGEKKKKTPQLTKKTVIWGQKEIPKIAKRIVDVQPMVIPERYNISQNNLINITVPSDFN